MCGGMREYLCIARWKQPVPIDKWAPKILNGTQAAPACPQPPCSLPSILCPKIVGVLEVIYVLINFILDVDVGRLSIFERIHTIIK